jgi:hypothetical protein
MVMSLNFTDCYRSLGTMSTVGVESFDASIIGKNEYNVGFVLGRLSLIAQFFLGLPSNSHFSI